MNTAKNSNIVAILPLSEMQEGILIHHLHSKWDEGFLHVEFNMDGDLDRAAFVRAWVQGIKRHDILRTTVHWENIEKPLQVVHADMEAKWNYHDWTGISTTKQQEKLKTLKVQNRESGLDFTKSPLVNLHLITLDTQKHYFLWPCHHLLLDGWSGSNIIKDVLAYYDGLYKGDSIELEQIPSLKTYYGWLRARDPLETKNFWSSYLEGINKIQFLSKPATGIASEDKLTEKVDLTREETIALNNYAKANKITLNSLVQGAWAILLSVYFNSEDIVFGTTISGRSNDFPNIDKLAGVFTNILPIRGLVTPSILIEEWLQQFQSRQLNSLKYGHVDQNDISNILNTTAGGTLFDNLLIFENYPSKRLKSGDLEIHGFRSGITSNYPLSLLVLPRDEMNFRFIFQEGRVDGDTRNWILSNWKKVLEAIASNKNVPVKDIKASINPPDFRVNPKADEISAYDHKNFVAPRNKLEFQLATIWGNLLGNKMIGVEDNYFEAGGKSLMALKMIALIEKELGVKLPLTSLLFHPTISLLSKEIERVREDGATSDWKHLIPLKVNGNKSPVFCIHGGEGHVLFYKQMSSHLDEERPVYLLQPKGIEGDGPMHQSIEEMSQDYISEILQIPDVNCYNLVFYCYSAIVVEMCKQFKQLGKSVNLIVIDSWARPIIMDKKPGFTERIRNYLKILGQNPVLAVKGSIVSRYRRSIEPVVLRLSNNKIKKQLARIRKHLSSIYYRYNWEKIDAPCTLIIADKEHPELKKNKVASWKFWVISEVEVKYSPGDHFSMFQEPNSKALAKNIEEASR